MIDAIEVYTKDELRAVYEYLYERSREVENTLTAHTPLPHETIPKAAKGMLLKWTYLQSWLQHHCDIILNELNKRCDAFEELKDK